MPPVQHIQRVVRAGGCLSGSEGLEGGLLVAQWSWFSGQNTGRGPGFNSQ